MSCWGRICSDTHTHMHIQYTHTLSLSRSLSLSLIQLFHGMRMISIFSLDLLPRRSPYFWPYGAFLGLVLTSKVKAVMLSTAPGALAFAYAAMRQDELS